MNLLFDFTVDKDTHTIYITREFAAGIDLVWDAFTKADILDQWSAPKPWKAHTKEMDFRDGGRWLYAMVSPDNVSHWSLVEFLEIHPKSSFSTHNSFCDENGNPAGGEFTSSLCRNTFREGTDITTVHISKKMANLAQLEKFIAMGFREGVAAGMANLDKYLDTLLITK